MAALLYCGRVSTWQALVPIQRLGVAGVHPLENTVPAGLHRPGPGGDAHTFVGSGIFDE